MWVMEKDISPTDSDALSSLLHRIIENYKPPPPSPGKRGKQRDFSALSFLLLAVVAVVLRTFSDSELHKLLSTDEDLRRQMGFCRLPHRTTIARRLVALIEEAEAQVAALGQHILEEVKPEAEQPELSAIDGRMYKAKGPRWHKKDRQAKRVPVELRNVDTESSWSRSGYRGWVQGYRLMLQGLVFPCPVPIWAVWRANSENEARIAQTALEQDQLPVTKTLLGDTTFGGEAFRQAYWKAGGWVLTPKQLPRKRRSWKTELYEYRKESIELLFQRIIQASGLKECPVKGNGGNGAFVLASVWIYQICLLGDYREGKPLGHIKDYLDCARWRIKT